MIGNKMDSIVIMDKKNILLVIIYNKTRGTYMKNLSNNEWKVLCMHMKLVYLTLGIE
jgi:hypothetical protein